MIVVTGQPRCGTSMMTRCIHLAGVPLAFYHNPERLNKDVYRNIYGFYEGAWNGADGVIKVVHCPRIDQFKPYEVRYILMTREPSKIAASWRAVREKTNQPVPQNNNPHVVRVGSEKHLANLSRQFDMIRERIKDAQYIEVDYDTFVTNPEHYREMFTTLFPELDFDIIIKGIDTNLYINR